MDFNKKIKIGILGCASIGERSVLPALFNLDTRFTIVAIASRSIEKATKFAAKYNCTPILGYENLLNQDIDAIYIPLPTALHHEWVIKSLNRGLHVYVEKSIAISFESAFQMVENAKKNQLVLMEGYMFQYHPQHLVVKKLLTEKTIGKIRSFRSSFGFPPLQKDNFRYNLLLGGGSLLDAGGYTLKALNFVLGDNFKVAASTLSKAENDGVDIFGNALLIDKTGVGAHISFGFDNYYQCSYEIWGSLGKITVPKAFTPKKDESTKVLLETNEISKTFEIQPSDQFENSFISFYDKIFNKTLRLKEYKYILNQSYLLNQIKNLNQITL
jgi:NDP-hexose-3-ketoreductase